MKKVDLIIKIIALIACVGGFLWGALFILVDIVFEAGIHKTAVVLVLASAFGIYQLIQSIFIVKIKS